MLQLENFPLPTERPEDAHGALLPTPIFLGAPFVRSLEGCGWTKTSLDVSRFPPPTTYCHHAREHPQALAFREEVTGAQSRDHVTALALATAVPPTLAPGPAP